MRKLLIAILLAGLNLSTFSQDLDIIGQWKVQWHLVIDDQDYDHKYFIEESPLSPIEHVFNKDGSVTTTTEAEQHTGLWRMEENRQLHITYHETKKIDEGIINRDLKFSPHMFRRSYATALYKSGMGIKGSKRKRGMRPWMC